MNPNPSPEEQDVESLLTEQDVADLETLRSEPSAPNPQPFYPILKVWTELLKAAANIATDRIEIHWASRITSMYTHLTFADMPEFQRRYYAKVQVLADLLATKVADDDECFNVLDEVEDREHNGPAYRALIDDWQVQFVLWELEWDTTDPQAGVELAAMSEVHKLFFSDKGLTEHLQNIQLQYTEDDAIALQERVAELKAGR